MKSILQSECECYRCKTTYNLHEHHIFFGTGYRPISEKYGLKVYLCANHHNMSNAGVHFDRAFDLELKQEAQRAFEAKHSHEEFMRLIGRNYL